MQLWAEIRVGSSQTLPNWFGLDICVIQNLLSNYITLHLIFAAIVQLVMGKRRKTVTEQPLSHTFNTFS
jgi:hypothetical protein